MAKRIQVYRPPGSSSAPVPRYTPHRPARAHDQIGGTKFTSHTLWRRARAAQLAASPLCADCLAIGMDTAATQVHHRVKRADDMSLAFDPDNLVSLCASCHSRRTGRGE